MFQKIAGSREHPNLAGIKHTILSKIGGLTPRRSFFSSLQCASIQVFFATLRLRLRYFVRFRYNDAEH